MVRPLYWFAPADIIHTWAEVFVGGRWVGLRVSSTGAYLAGAHTHRCSALSWVTASAPTTWRLPGRVARRRHPDPGDGVNQDFGVYDDDPDSFYRAHGVNARGIKGWLYSQVMRKAMNRRVARIRAQADRVLSPQH